jgi:hypothetical protein
MERFRERYAGTIVRLGLLGPVDVMSDGVVQTVSGLRRKAVLVILWDPNMRSWR